MSYELIYVKSSDQFLLMSPDRRKFKSLEYLDLDNWVYDPTDMKIIRLGFDHYVRLKWYHIRDLAVIAEELNEYRRSLKLWKLKGRTTIADLIQGHINTEIKTDYNKVLFAFPMGICSSNDNRLVSCSGQRRVEVRIEGNGLTYICITFDTNKHRKPVSSEETGDLTKALKFLFSI